jgi:SAM-dependent methyltransferase
MENKMNSVIPFELQLLTNAINYQQWLIETVSPFLGSRVLELGAGIGNMSFNMPAKELFVASEANRDLFAILQQRLSEKQNKGEPIVCELLDLNSNWVSSMQKYEIDTIISFNVMEHIENDCEAFKQQIEILKNNPIKKEKKIITFVPAHDWAFGTLDKEFGHFRRYSVKHLNGIFKEIAPGAPIYHRHFNLLGLPGWFLNGKILKTKTFNENQIKIFEALCPFIKGADDFIHSFLKLPLGQSLLYVVTIK